MRYQTTLLGVGFSVLLGLAGCSSSNDTTAVTTTQTGHGGSGGGSGGSGGAGGSTAVCTDPTAVPCSDQVIQQMNLKSTTAPGLISTVADGEGWYSLADATAGGAFNPNPHAYVYAKFNDTGLDKVAISDEQSLDSMDWDIAFRRYVIRINSGNSGPSCVTAARLPGTPPPDYDNVTTLPDNLTYHADEYFTASPDCSLIPDGTGLPDSPATALGSYWSYPGCVAMTGNVFVLELANGRHLKLTVTEYYWDAQAAEPGAGQAACDDSGTAPTTGSANIHFRWAYLP
jgi:hypothetical protein